MRSALSSSQRAAAALLAFAAAFLVWFAAAAFAQEQAGAREQEIAQTSAALSEIRSRIVEGDAEDLRGLEARLREIRDDSRARLEPVRREISVVEMDRSALGEPPGEDDPPETEALAERRAEINRQLGALRGQEIQISANIAEATELLARLSAQRVGALYERVIERGAPLVSPALWRSGASSSGEIVDKIGAYFDRWAQSRRAGGGLALPLFAIIAAFGVSLLLFGPVNRWITASFTSRIERYEPTPDRRVVAAGLKMVARAAPGIVGGLIVFETLRAFGVITEEGDDVARAAWFALVAFLLVEGFASGLFASKNPRWRIAPLVEEQGKKAGAYVIAIVAIFGLKTVMGAIAQTTEAGPAATRLLDGVSAMTIGVLLFLLCRRQLWKPSLEEAAKDEAGAQTGAEAEENSGDRWRPVRRFSRAVALVTILAPLFGYVALADFVTSRFYYLALLLAVAWFARALMREIAAWSERRLRASSDRARAETSEDDKSFDRFWINLAIDTVFLIALAPALFVLVGFQWSAVFDLFKQAFFGFRIGGFEVPSLASILIAILAFLVVIGLTRMVQRGLAKGPFKHSRIDVGVQNSLTTLIGYAGLVVAFLVGVTALGFNLGNLAIIAGALSVGIGFGLQSIVNNFVSGLILLFERPIKVGDWVVTTSGEGTVKKISVRSTEIETFDRATIVVPNSELISQTVTNWTHKDKIGRITVPVGVSYGSDPEKVKDILLKCAHNHPLIVRYPEPFVVWKDFGASSLDFEVRAYLRDISDGLSVRTELRFAIFKAFKEAGIEIPFPQQDIYIKSLPSGEAVKKPDAAPAEGRRNPIPPREPEEPELAEDD